MPRARRVPPGASHGSTVRTHRFFRALGELGRFLIFSGVVCALFIGYLLWGTGYETSRDQAVLKGEIAHQLPPEPTLAPASGPNHSTIPTQVLIPASKVPLGPQPPGPPPPSGTPLALLVIPKIGLNIAVVQGTDTASLRLGPGHYTSTSLPGYAGNVAIAGHRTTYLHPFYSLDSLGANDPIELETTEGALIYAVTNVDVRSPYDVGVLNQAGDDRLTLTTCNPRYSAATRLVVTAHYVGVLVTVHGKTPVLPPKHPHASIPRRSAVDRSLLAGTQGAALPALLWALAIVALAVASRAVAAWLARRGVRKRWRAGTYSVGTLGVVALLLPFFLALAAVLPASF